MASRACILRLNATYNIVHVPCRFSNTLSHKIVEHHRRSKLSHTKEPTEQPPSAPAPRDYQVAHPDFLPDPIWYRRDRVAERLQRRDMVKRRLNLDIPEFYVGSIMAVTVTDPHSPGKKSRFLGICIYRGGHMLRSEFILRNIIDGQGVEMLFEMYNPTLQKIEVLKLERRLDDELFYLRDCPQQHSTVPFDFEPVPHPPGAPVPVNSVKIKLGPRPWERRWERHELQGVADLELPERFYIRAKEVSKPWEKQDIMKQYRASINEEDKEQILSEFHQEMTEMEKQKARRRRMLPMDAQ